jgi:phosphoribosylformylglycinamidine synthase
MRFGIVTFPGSNCDTDAYNAIVDVLGEDAVMLWHKSHDLEGVDIVVLPGGFAYGDYLRAGAIARFSPIMREVCAHAERGGPVLAICNGFQVACEAGLLPGALVRNAGLSFICAPVRLRVENADTAFTSAYERGQLLQMPIAHSDGRYVASAAVLDALEGEGASCFGTWMRTGSPRRPATPTVRPTTSRGSSTPVATSSA